MSKPKMIRYSITVLGIIEVDAQEKLNEERIYDLIANDYYQLGGDLGLANDVEYEVIN